MERRTCAFDHVGGPAPPALGWCAFALCLDGRPADARVAAQEAVDLGLRLGHRTAEVLACRVVILARAMLGELSMPEVADAVRQDVEGMEGIDSPRVSQSHAWLSGVFTLTGQLDAGLAEADVAVASEPVSGFSRLSTTFRFLNRAYARDEAGLPSHARGRPGSCAR
ncbi:MAG: hypothetical protein Q8K58_05670 [Acidimicrobiales bacterium]|nr:hypothetical protein [Acidimicrobiales bacterium]